MDPEETTIPQTYGIAAALSEALEAAVFADSSAAYKAYDMIAQYAYDGVKDENGTVSMQDGTKATEEKALAMATFKMSDSNGTMREVSIPKITMMPLPLLHVTEADFEIKMTTSVVSAQSTENTSMDQTANTTTETNLGRARKKARAAAEEIRDTVEAKARAAASKRVFASRRLLIADKALRPTATQLTNLQQTITNKTTSTDNNASTIDMKVNLKMRQAELPDGIKLLLQAAANSLHSAAVKLNGEE